MKAIDIKKKFIKSDLFEDVGIIAISKDNYNMFWYHVHEDEELPNKEEYEIAIHIRR